MGYVFGRISDMHLQLPGSGLYLLVKAQMPRRNRFITLHAIERTDLTTSRRFSIFDRDSRAVFGNGWYPANHLPPVARWMSDRSWLQFEARSVLASATSAHDSHSRLKRRRSELEFKLNGELIGSLCLFDYGWFDLRSTCLSRSYAGDKFRLEISARSVPGNRHSQIQTAATPSLSIAVCNLKIS